MNTKAFVIILSVLILFITFGAVALNNLTTEDEIALLTQYENSIQEKFFVYDLRPTEEYIYSLYKVRDEDKIGIMEFSTDTERNIEKTINEENATALALKGDYNNYIGIVFHTTPEKVRSIKLMLSSGKSMEIEINARDDFYIMTFLQIVEIDLDELTEIEVYDKNGGILYTVPI
ncbi:hypothetical protein [Sutcliffiella rhizosphaerae]|uniref:Uncharacterized protein n=1 Tax=Sutcliffiella rhizosphaerae TaxID=2880967 RepID=A0ABN8AC09_9BACI|nr:hypothetical protein [Sutcliffiella rhizosphaerae]CAG9622753.1 hypothetical protein BACCIP111883_03544 [Sutcliffiella rhizosphaerae]